MVKNVENCMQAMFMVRPSLLTAMFKELFIISAIILLFLIHANYLTSQNLNRFFFNQPKMENGHAFRHLFT